MQWQKRIPVNAVLSLATLSAVVVFGLLILGELGNGERMETMLLMLEARVDSGEIDRAEIIQSVEALRMEFDEWRHSTSRPD